MIISETTTVGYQQEFNRIGMQINDSLTTDDWMELYKKLVYWELELESSQVQMTDMLRMQKEEANKAFGKFVKKNYVNWIQNPAERPLMSPDLFKKKVFPLLDNDEKVFFILIDNFRLDQWRVVKTCWLNISLSMKDYITVFCLLLPNMHAIPSSPA